MDIHFKGKVNQTGKYKGIWIKSITLHYDTGNSVQLDREFTEYTIDSDGNLDMTWKDAFLYNNCSNGFTCHSKSTCITCSGEITLIDVEVLQEALSDGYRVVINEAV